MANVIIIIILVAAVSLSCYKIYSNKKKGKSCSGCSCSSFCGGTGECETLKQKKNNQ